MILIIANKKNNSSVYVPVDKLRTLRVYEECNYGWNENGAESTKKEVKWSLEITVDNEECLCIAVGEENIARALADEIPLYISGFLIDSKPCVYVDVEKFIEERGDAA